MTTPLRSVRATSFGAVSRFWASMGIPTADWQAWASAESSLNPNAVGDNGTSLGLYQLHEGGQLPKAFYPPSRKAFNPLLNAAVAAPSLIQGYREGLSMGYKGQQLAVYAAEHGGHPGTLPMGQYVAPNPNGNVYAREASRIAQAYNAFKTSPATGWNTSAGGGASGSGGGSAIGKSTAWRDVLRGLHQAESFSTTQFSLGGIFTGADEAATAKDLGVLMVRFLIAAIGLLMIAFALFTIVGSSGLGGAIGGLLE